MKHRSSWIRVFGFGLLTAAGVLAFNRPAQAGEIAVDTAYQFQRQSCSGCTGESIPAGFMVDASGELTPMLGWVAQIDLGRKSESGATNTDLGFNVGARWMPASMSKAKPFLQALVGIVRSSTSFSGFSASESKLDFEGDAGAVIKGSGKIDFVVEVGFRRITFDPGVNAIKADAGVVWHFGAH